MLRLNKQKETGASRLFCIFACGAGRVGRSGGNLPDGIGVARKGLGAGSSPAKDKMPEQAEAEMA